MPSVMAVGSEADGPSTSQYSLGPSHCNGARGRRARAVGGPHEYAWRGVTAGEEKDGARVRLHRLLDVHAVDRGG